jgi:PAS domain S-box-containing protein
LDRFGYTQEDFDTGLNAYDMISPKDRERVMENTERMLKGEKPAPEAYQALRKDGTTFTARLYSTPILREGKPVGLRGFIMEVADQEITEVSLAKTQEVHGPTMKVQFGDQNIEINEGLDNIKMGRDADNDLVFDQKSASRVHALLTHRGDKFLLIDQSKNGTFVHIKGKKAIVVKQDEYLLTGSGIIGLGCRVGPDSKDAIKFRVSR